jgi:hypothetical protein
MVFYYRLDNITSWWAFLTAAAQQSGVWGSYNPWAHFKGLEYLLNSGTYAFSIVNPRGDEVTWMIISRSLSWALLGLVVVMMVTRAIKREWFGVVCGGIIFIAMTFINWWEAPTTDYWVIMWIFVLLLLAWAGRGRLRQVLALWLIFYIPAQLTVNWHYQLAEITAPDADLKGRLINEMLRHIEPGNTILLTDDANLALRSQMAGVQVILFSRMYSSNNAAIGSFIEYFSNPETKDLKFVANDSLYRSFSSNIKPFLPNNYVQAVAASFANAAPLVEVSDRYGRKLAIWALGGSR